MRYENTSTITLYFLIWVVGGQFGSQRKVNWTYTLLKTLTDIGTGHCSGKVYLCLSGVWFLKDLRSFPPVWLGTVHTCVYVFALGEMYDARHLTLLFSPTHGLVLRLTVM